MRNAVRVCIEGQSTTKTAGEFGIPARTLRRYVANERRKRSQLASAPTSLYAQDQVVPPYGAGPGVVGPGGGNFRGPLGYPAGDESKLGVSSANLLGGAGGDRSAFSRGQFLLRFTFHCCFTYLCCCVNGGFGGVYSRRFAYMLHPALETSQGLYPQDSLYGYPQQRRSAEAYLKAPSDGFSSDFNSSWPPTHLTHSQNMPSGNSFGYSSYLSSSAPKPYGSKPVTAGGWAPKPTDRGLYSVPSARPPPQPAAMLPRGPSVSGLQNLPPATLPRGPPAPSAQPPPEKRTLASGLMHTGHPPTGHPPSGLPSVSMAGLPLAQTRLTPGPKTVVPRPIVRTDLPSGTVGRIPSSSLATKPAPSVPVPHPRPIPGPGIPMSTMGAQGTMGAPTAAPPAIPTTVPSTIPSTVPSTIPSTITSATSSTTAPTAQMHGALAPMPVVKMETDTQPTPVGQTEPIIKDL